MAQINNPFQKATKTQARLRMALYGPSGSGKTYSALAIGTSLGKVALIDTERGSASKYANLFEFDVLELADHHPNNYIAAIQAASEYGYEVLIIDSLSHAWKKVLQLVDDINRRSKSNNQFIAWRDVTPLQNQFIDAILTAPLHVIATMRSKTEYVMEKDERDGKIKPRKVGLAPIQRDDVEFEFDVVAEMNFENDFIVTKTRCPELNGACVRQPGADVGAVLKAWLSDGAPAVSAEPEAPRNTPTQFVYGENGDEIPADAWHGEEQDEGSMFPPDDAPANEYPVDAVKVVAQGGNHMYLLRSGKTNIALFSGDVFREAQIDPEPWKAAINKWHSIRLVATANFDGSKWIVHSVRAETEAS